MNPLLLIPAIILFSIVVLVAALLICGALGFFGRSIKRDKYPPLRFCAICGNQLEDDREAWCHKCLPETSKTVTIQKAMSQGGSIDSRIK